MMKTKDEHPSVVGQRYFYGESGKRNYRKAFPYLLEAALAGDVHPQNLVGYCINVLPSWVIRKRNATSVFVISKESERK